MSTNSTDWNNDKEIFNLSRQVEAYSVLHSGLIISELWLSEAQSSRKDTIPYAVVVRRLF